MVAVGRKRGVREARELLRNRSGGAVVKAGESFQISDLVENGCRGAEAILWDENRKRKRRRRWDGGVIVGRKTFEEKL